MTDVALVEAQRCFDAGEDAKGLALVKVAVSDAGSPQVIRDAFNLLQQVLGRAARTRPLLPVNALPPLPAEPLVSVALPTLNRPALLADALDSLARQDYSRWEVLVVNDAGDPIDAVVRASAAATRARIVNHDERSGLAYARNTAIDQAKGEIVCFLDDDDRYFPAHLDTVVKAISAGAAIAYTGCETVIERLADGARIDLSRKRTFMPERYSAELLRVRNYLPQHCCAVRRACFEQAGMFDEMIGRMSDWDLLLRLAARWDFAQVNQVTVEYRLREAHIDDSLSKHDADMTEMLQAVYDRHAGDDSDLVRFARKLYVWLIATGNFSPPARAASA
jgi:glycosyltransferase involved in cell wall biosynthesis